MALFDDASLVTTPNGYKAGTLYSIKPTSGLGDMTVVRATTATRVNSAGLIESMANNVPRLDYSNGSCPSLLVEPQRTNSATYSEQFDNAAWQKRNNIAITTNATTSPDGTLTADKMYLSNNLIADYGCFQIITSASRTFSVYAKKAELQYLFLGFNNDNASEGVFFNLNTGAISQNTGAYTATISDAGNGWYRCTAYFPTISYCFISPSINGTSFLVTGQLNNGIYIWGAQLEVGSYPTSYIPTTSAAVTRNADVISKTGISALIGQTEGTIFGQVAFPNLSAGGNSSYLYITDGSFTNAVIIGREPASPNSKLFFYINAGGSNVLANTANNLQSGFVKMAIGYKSGSWAAFLNGSLVATGTDTLTFSGTMSNFGIGTNNGAMTNMTESMIANLAILFPTRLTNAELISLTT